MVLELMLVATKLVMTIRSILKLKQEVCGSCGMLYAIEQTYHKLTRQHSATCPKIIGPYSLILRGNPFVSTGLERLPLHPSDAPQRLNIPFSHLKPRRRRFAADNSIVAPFNETHSLSRRKSTATSASAASRPQVFKPTRIVYRESLESESDLPFWQTAWFIAVLFVMAIGFFGVAIVLFLSLDSDFSVSSVSAATEGVEITYGSVIKLMHEKTKFRLHSHDVPYGSGSGQQSVTGFPSGDDANSYWIVKAVPDTSEKQGDSIKTGSVIRLQHMKTRKWLHSHLHASPISGNLEVSCFGGETESDTGDHWRLQIEGNGKTWRQDQRVRLQHLDTGGYLHSHNKKYSRIAGGQQEVCGLREKRADNVWLAAEGVYLPVTEGKTTSS